MDATLARDIMPLPMYRDMHSKAVRFTAANLEAEQKRVLDELAAANPEAAAAIQGGNLADALRAFADHRLRSLVDEMASVLLSIEYHMLTIDQAGRGKGSTLCTTGKQCVQAVPCIRC